MSFRRVQFKIWWLMAATAIVAISLAWFGPAGAVAIVSLLLIALLPMICSSPERRLLVAGWVLALYPLMIPVALYLTWLTAWAVLGHRPRPSLDDPKRLGPIVLVPCAMFFLLLNSRPVLWTIAACADVILTIGWFRRPSVASPLVIPPCWLAAYLIMMWDPQQVLYWCMD